PLEGWMGSRPGARARARRLHLDEREHVAVGHDQIDLPARAADVAIEDLKSPPAQVGGGEILPQATGRRRRPCRSRRSGAAGLVVTITRGIGVSLSGLEGWEEGRRAGRGGSRRACEDVRGTNTFPGHEEPEDSGVHTSPGRPERRRGEAKRHGRPAVAEPWVL